MSSSPSMAPADIGEAARNSPFEFPGAWRGLHIACGLVAAVAVTMALGAVRSGSSGARAASPVGESAHTANAADWSKNARMLQAGMPPARRGASSSETAVAARGAVSPFLALPPLHIVNNNTSQSLDVRLYDAGGHVDEEVAIKLDSLLGDTRDPELPFVTRLDRRTLQLVFRAAYHFHAATVQVVSAYRAPRGTRESGPHALGRAIDFKLPGVKAVALAQYLRQTPRAGVGVYTHRRTQYVHLDARETSFHWLDASPPNRHWREKSIGPRSMAKLDARYRREGDWPEGTEALAPRD